MESIKKGNFKFSNVSENIIVFFISFLVFLILFAPTVLQYIKGIPIFALVVISFLMVAKKMTIPVHYRVFIWILIYTTLNFLYLLKGTHDELDVFLQLLPVNVIWPIIYILVFIIPTSRINKVDLTRIFILSTLLIETFILYLYFNFMGILPTSPLLNLPLGQSVNYNFGYINLFSPSITSLFFLLPYVVSILLTKKNRRRTVFFYILLLIFGVIISLVIGRRTLIAVVLISPFISFFWTKISKNNDVKYTKIIVIVIVMAIISLVYLSTVDVGLRLQNLDTELIKSGTSVRKDQFISLIEGWKQSPLFGVGYGVNADVVRSANVPGAYELSYVARLFHMGIVGIVIYFFMVLWLMRKLIAITKSNPETGVYIIPLLTGLSSLILAESTNPYIGSFDGMWVFFYTLAIINNIYLKKSKGRLSDVK